MTNHLSDRAIFDLHEGDDDGARAHLCACTPCAERHARFARDVERVIVALRQGPPAAPARIPAMTGWWIPPIAVAVIQLLVLVWVAWQSPASDATPSTTEASSALFATDEIEGATLATRGADLGPGAPAVDDDGVDE